MNETHRGVLRKVLHAYENRHKLSDNGITRILFVYSRRTVISDFEYELSDET